MPRPHTKTLSRSARRPVSTLFFLGALTLSLVLALGSCAKKAPWQGNGEDKSLALVNGEAIRAGDFQQELRRQLAPWQHVLETDVKGLEEAARLVLQSQVDAHLFAQEAERVGIAVDRQAAQAQLEDLLLSGEGAPEGETLPPLNTSLQDWRTRMQTRMREAALIEHEVLAKIDTSEAELRSLYEAQKQDLALPQRVRVRHIAVGSLKKHDEVHRALRRRERDFTALVHAYSTTPDRERDGDLGYAARGEYPKRFDQAIFALRRVGDVSPRRPPVRTEMGYHIFQLLERRPQKTLSYEEALPQLKERLIQQKREQAYRTWRNDLRARAQVVIDENRFQQAVQSLWP